MKKEIEQVLHIHKMLASESKVGKEKDLSAGRKEMDAYDPLRNSSFPIVIYWTKL